MSEFAWKYKAEYRADMPGYWMHETSGVLRPAIEAYLSGGEMSDDHIAAMRAYLRQWIMVPAWIDAGFLRLSVSDLTTRAQIDRWLADALHVGIDPL